MTAQLVSGALMDSHMAEHGVKLWINCDKYRNPITEQHSDLKGAVRPSQSKRGVCVEVSNRMLESPLGALSNTFSKDSNKGGYSELFDTQAKLKSGPIPQPKGKEKQRFHQTG